MSELRERRLAEWKAALAISEKVIAEDRDYTDEEQADYARHMKTADEQTKRIEQADKDDALRKQINDLGGVTTSDLVQVKGSLGERFVNDEGFKTWMRRLAPSGQIPESVKGLQSPPVMFKHLGLFRKDLVTGSSDTSGGAFVNTDITGIYEELPRLPVVMRDLIDVRRTTSDTVEYVRQTAHATAAAPTAEADGEYETGEKPEATITWEKVTATVKTIPVWIPATKRALADAAQLRGLIDSDLRGDLADAVEDQIVNGDGTGENFLGILATPNVLAQPFDTDIFRTTRLGKLAVMETGRAQPTAYVVNPEDWADIELTQDGQNRYYYGGPLSNGEKRLWGLPVIECSALAAGQILVGDFRKVSLWDREQANISISDSHADYFIRNMVAILAEMRAAFGVRRPAALCVIDATGS